MLLVEKVIFQCCFELCLILLVISELRILPAVSGDELLNYYGTSV